MLRGKYFTNLSDQRLAGKWFLNECDAEPIVAGVSLFGSIGYAGACILGLSLLRNILRSRRSNGWPTT